MTYTTSPTAPTAVPAAGSDWRSIAGRLAALLRLHTYVGYKDVSDGLKAYEAALSHENAAIYARPSKQSHTDAVRSIIKQNTERTHGGNTDE